MMEVNQNQLRVRLNELVADFSAKRMTTTNLAKAIGIDRATLTHFLNGRPGRRKSGGPQRVMSDLFPKNEAKVRAYLRKVHDWPPTRPRLTPAELLAKAKMLGTKAPSKSARERFLESIHGDDFAGVSSISWRGIEAQGDGVTWHYQPKGGLIEPDYDYFASTFDDVDDRRLLAEAVVINILRARGLTTLEAERAALKLKLLETEIEEIERIGFDALADEAEARFATDKD